MARQLSVGDEAEPVLEDPGAEVNRVELQGRLPAGAEVRTLPSGDEIVTFRVVVKRPPGAATGAKVDTVDCTAWNTDLAHRILEWPAGSRVAVEGALRRRFWRAAGGIASRTEVEVDSARLVPPPAPDSPVRD